jgi:hypothetical protein
MGNWKIDGILANRFASWEGSGVSGQVTAGVSGQVTPGVSGQVTAGAGVRGPGKRGHSASIVGQWSWHLARKET